MQLTNLPEVTVSSPLWSAVPVPLLRLHLKNTQSENTSKCKNTKSYITSETMAPRKKREQGDKSCF